MVEVRKHLRLSEAVKYSGSYYDHFGSNDPLHTFLLLGNDVRAQSFLQRFTDVHMRGLPESIVVLAVESTGSVDVERIQLKIRFTSGWCCHADVLMNRDSDPWFDPTDLISWNWSPCAEKSAVL